MITIINDSNSGEKKRNPIDEKFDGLLADIETDYNSKIEGSGGPEDGMSGTLLDKFALWAYTSDELISMGFCNKNVKRVMDGVDDKSINEYFDNVVSGLTAIDIGGIDMTDNAGCTTIGQFVFQVKRYAIISYLNLTLSKFIIELKSKNEGEKGNQNGTIN